MKILLWMAAFMAISTYESTSLAQGPSSEPSTEIHLYGDRPSPQPIIDRLFSLGGSRQTEQSLPPNLAIVVVDRGRDGQISPSMEEKLRELVREIHQSEKPKHLLILDRAEMQQALQQFERVEQQRVHYSGALDFLKTNFGGLISDPARRRAFAPYFGVSVLGIAISGVQLWGVGDHDVVRKVFLSSFHAFVWSTILISDGGRNWNAYLDWGKAMNLRAYWRAKVATGWQTAHERLSHWEREAVHIFGVTQLNFLKLFEFYAVQALIFRPHAFYESFFLAVTEVATKTSANLAAAVALSAALNELRHFVNSKIYSRVYTNISLGGIFLGLLVATEVAPKEIFVGLFALAGSGWAYLKWRHRQNLHENPARTLISILGPAPQRIRAGPLRCLLAVRALSSGHQ